MRARIAGAAMAAIVGMTVASATGYIWAQGSPADLAAAARAAAKEFRPLTEAEVDQARTELAAAVARLDQRLQADTVSGPDWRAYLKLSDLQAQLGSPKLGLTELKQIHTKFASGEPGLGLACFRDVRHALEAYLNVSQAVGNAQIKDQYQVIMDGLARHLESYGKAAAPDDAAWISGALHWLENYRQADALVAGIRQLSRMPNLFIEVSPSVVEGAIGAGPVDATAPISDVILGTSIFGTGHTTGQLAIQFAPDTERAVVDAVFTGSTATNNVGYHGPVTICSVAQLQIGTVKRMWVNSEGAFALPAVSCANACSTITGICACSPLIQQIACRKADKQHALADQIGAQHAQQRASAQADQRSQENLVRANQTYAEKFRGPLNERGLFPEQLHFSTTQERLLTIAMAANTFQLAAPGAPPQQPGGADLSLRLHESMINNLAAAALGGMLLREADVQAMITSLLGYLPDELKSDEEPWAIKFADQQPVSLYLGDNTVRLTLRGASFMQGSATHPGMNITATYQIVKTGETFKVVRQGPLEIFPPGFVPGKSRGLTNEQLVIRDILRRRLKKVFRDEIVSKGLTPQGNWAGVGKLLPIFFESKDGWANVAWKRVPPPNPPAVKL